MNICGTFWDQNYNWLSARKIEKGSILLGRFEEIVDFRGEGGAFYDQNRTWFSAKEVEKKLDIVYTFLEKSAFVGVFVV